MKKVIVLFLGLVAVFSSSAGTDSYIWDEYTTRYGWRSGWGSWGYAATLYGAGAGSFGDYLNGCTFIGAAAGAFSTNIPYSIGIGYRALKGAEGGHQGWYGHVVAIGHEELAGTTGHYDTTSINKQLYIGSSIPLSSGGTRQGFWINPVRDDHRYPEVSPVFYTNGVSYFNDDTSELRFNVGDVVYTNTVAGWLYFAPTNIVSDVFMPVTGEPKFAGGRILINERMFPLYARFSFDVDGEAAGSLMMFYADDPRLFWRHVATWVFPDFSQRRVNEWQLIIRFSLNESPVEIVLARFDDVTGEHKGAEWMDNADYLSGAPRCYLGAPPNIFPNDPATVSLRSVAAKMGALKGKSYDFSNDIQFKVALADLIELFGGSVTNFFGEDTDDYPPPHLEDDDDE